MIDKQVSVDFDVNGQQYGASMQQMVAATQAYSASADTMLGKMTKISGFITNTMMKASNGLTGANKNATAQAAAYQQKMSGLEATAKLIGEKTFPKLEKQTLKLARQFPIGIGQAVETMESLQKSGIKAGDTMGKLAVTYTKLGAATGTYAPAIGEAMTEFTRSMGNNLNMAEGFGDSLTTLTKQYGGSAQSVLAFSKSIAPIASTIGMNQAQVMGMSTAFSRLGEDGFAAGNALNKVMIDLNKASRDGGPELRAYANAMNKSVDELSTQLQDSPASVLVDFTEAINKAGPDAIRTLDSLGIEGVRTVKAFTALSREGNLGEIIDTAGSSYGSGSTSEAAENALSGVNDQMTMLSETTSQMVASAGKPFLGWLEAVLKAANSVNEVFAKMAASGFGQTLAKVGAVAGAGGGLAMTALQAAGTYGLVRRGGRALTDVAGRFMGGRAAATLGVAPAEGLLASMGHAFGRVSPTPEPGGMGRGARRAGGAVKGGGRLFKDAFTLALNTTASDMRTSIGEEGFESKGGKKFRSAWSDMTGGIKGGNAGGALSDFSKQMKDMARTSAETGKQFGRTTQAFKNLGAASLAMGADVTRVGGKAAKGGLGMVGAGLAGLGVSGPMAAVAGVAAVGYAGYKWRQNTESTLGAAKAGGEDPFRQFNDFAVKAGYATESIQLLGKASADAAKTIADKNKTDEDAYKLSAEELSTATAPGYKPAWEGAGGATGNAKEDAVLSFLQNQNASQSQIAYQGMDVEAQFRGTGQQFLSERQAMEGMEFGDVIQAAVQTSNSQRGFMGRETEDSKATMEATAAYMQQRWATTSEQFGEEAGRKQKEEDVGAMYAKAVEASNAGQMNDATKYLQQLEQATGIKFSEFSSQSATGQASGWMKSGQTWEEALANLSTKEGATGVTAKEFADLNAKRDQPAAERENKALEASLKQTEAFNKATGATIDLTETMFAGNELAAENGKAVSELTETDMAQLTESQKAVALAQKNPNAQNVNEASRKVIEDAMTQAGGNVANAQGAIRQQLATASDDSSKAILAQALGGFGGSVEVARATSGQSQIQGIQTKIQMGQQAAAIPLPENATAEAVSAHESALAQQAQGIQEMEGVYRSFLMNTRNTMIQLNRQDADMARQRSRSQADFARSQKWAAQDHHHQVLMAEKQFQTAMERGDEDYYTGRKRAQRDFSKQMSRGDKQFKLQMSRQTEDFNRQMERMAEDNAKAMYDPYQRVEHKRVWDTKQLMKNIAEQNKALKRQMEQVDKLKESGLSQGAVDLLGLSDPQNAEQTAKLFSEMMNDPALVAQMNSEVEGRIDISKAFSTDTDNVQWRRTLEEYETNLTRQNEDYKTQTAQAREDFNTQMKDMASDYTKQKKRAREDFNLQMKEMNRAFKIQRERAQTQQKTMLSRMAADAKIARDAVIADLSRSASDMFATLDELSDETGTYISGMPTKYKTKLKSAIDSLMAEYDKAMGTQPPVEMKVKYVFYNPATKKYESAAGAAAGAWATSGGGDAEHPLEVPGEPPPSAGASSKPGGRASADGPTAGKGHWGGSWQYYGRGGFHGGADIGIPKGSGAYAVVNGRVKSVTTLATVQDPRGSYGRYVVISDGRTDFYYAHLSAQTVRAGQKISKGDMVGRTGNTGHTLPAGSGYHLHFEARPAGAGHRSAISPARWMSEGGIATRQINAVIGEGGPEMVLPLNERGAKMLAETMARYLGQADARNARVSPHTTTVIHNSKVHQDYSTNFSGPIAVEANDPAEFARIMRQQTRAKRLVQPIGGRG